MSGYKKEIENILKIRKGFSEDSNEFNEFSKEISTLLKQNKE
jgi:hypothetical protein